MNKIPTIKIRADKVVIVSGDHGGYTEGRCTMCDSFGWLVDKQNGLPFGSKNGANALRHEKRCPMNKVLKADGSFK